MLSGNLKFDTLKLKVCSCISPIFLCCLQAWRLWLCTLHILPGQGSGPHIRSAFIRVSLSQGPGRHAVSGQRQHVWECCGWMMSAVGPWVHPSSVHTISSVRKPSDLGVCTPVDPLLSNRLFTSSHSVGFTIRVCCLWTMVCALSKEKG